MKMNNNGFSLVEMVVAVLITGILMLGVGVFMNTSRTAYKTVDTSARLQEEAVTANTFLTELFLEAQAYGTKATEQKTIDGVTYDLQLLWIYARDNAEGASINEYCTYFILFEKVHGEDVGVLRYAKVPAGLMIPGDPSAISGGYKWAVPPMLTAVRDNYYYGIVGDKYQLIAKNVTAMNINDPQIQPNGSLISGTLEFSYADKDFSSNINVLSRNIRIK
ncbi:MAG: prepilin-type N-terminal cleavage/methylation domain-containing protein [Lachnospiraceae bacterium]|nr:prepilin-type N-terminal cleavage/methylation domain-containing protein [Lachnospiraceae bacterium]